MPTEEELLRAVVVRAVRARGALTEGGVAEHCRLKGGVARIRPHVDALVARGSAAIGHEVSTTAAPPCWFRPGASFDGEPHRGRPDLAVRQPAVGPRRSPGACSGSTT